MKLKEYVPIYANKFSRFERKTVHDFITFARLHNSYDSLENFVLWHLYRVLNRADNFVTFDEIRAKYPDVNDRHILTMLKAAFRMHFGADVETLANTTL